MKRGERLSFFGYIECLISEKWGPKDPESFKEFSDVSSKRILLLIKRRFRKNYQRLRRNAAYITKNYPRKRANIIKRADEALEGNLILWGGLGKLRFVGNPPKWHENPVGDNEYIWLLNRMEYWKNLLWAHMFTLKPEYAEKVITEFYDWIEKCPRPSLEEHNFSGATPWRSLEAGIRMYETWPLIFSFLTHTDFVDRKLVRTFISSAFEHAEVLVKICPKYYPKADHNHYLMENLGLYVLATNLPEMKMAVEWEDHAMNEMLRCLNAQITDGGGHIEGCPGYHYLAIFWFCLFIKQSQDRGRTIPEKFVDQVLKMMDYAIHTLRPTGKSVPWGDSDSKAHLVCNAVFWAHLVTGNSQPLSIVKQYVGKDLLIETAINASFYIDDLAKEIDFIKTGGVEHINMPTSMWQKDLKQVLYRGNWEEDALSIFFAGRTPVHNPHAHIDPLSFDFTGLGVSLVVDPGRFTYRDDPDRKTFKSACWHNMLLLNDTDPFKYISSWAYGPQKEGGVVSLIDQPDIKGAVCWHENYDPVLHKRLIAIVENRFCLILDQVSNIRPEDSIQVYFHLDFTSVKSLEDGAFAQKENICLLIKFSDEFDLSILDGKISDRVDHWRPSKRLRLEDKKIAVSTMLYPCILFPYKKEWPQPEIRFGKILGAQDKWTFNFRIDDLEFQFYWEGSNFWFKKAVSF